MKERLKKVLLWTALMILAGAGYGFWINKTGRGIPCPFHVLTGLKCPGCGVTHMCAAILRFDIAAAFASHPMLFSLSPVLLLLLVRGLWNYVREGFWHMKQWEKIAAWICVVLLMAFWVVEIYPFR